MQKNSQTGLGDDELLVGAWKYGKKPNRYTISWSDAGELRFDGPHKTGPVSGELEDTGRFFQASLLTPSGEKVGEIRLRFDRQNKTAISNFKGQSQEDWGKDIVAERELALLGGPAAFTFDPAAARNSTAKIKPKAEKPPAPVVAANIAEPLLLVGDINGWDIDVAKQRFRFKPKLQPLGPAVGEGRQSTLRVEVNKNDWEFQIVSAEALWNWRLYPDDFNRQALFPDGRAGASVKLLVGTNHSACQNRNFHVLSESGSILDIHVMVCSDQQFVWYTKPDTSSLRNGASVAARAEPEKKPHERTPDEISHLRVCGSFCSWRLETRGLRFDKSEERPREQTICFRMQARRINFQIVSNKLGFKWRLYPEDSSSRSATIPNAKVGRVKATLGGQDDGHGLNFNIFESFLSIIILKVEMEPPSGKQAGAIYLSYVVNNQKEPQVAIGVKSVQFPPTEVNFLNDALLEGAETEEEKKDILERRNELVLKTLERTTEEYKDETLQREVLALRRLFPYHSNKSALAIEDDGACRAMLTDGAAEDNADEMAAKAAEEAAKESEAAKAAEEASRAAPEDSDDVNEKGATEMNDAEFLRSLGLDATCLKAGESETTRDGILTVESGTFDFDNLDVAEMDALKSPKPSKNGFSPKARVTAQHTPKTLNGHTPGQRTQNGAAMPHAKSPQAPRLDTEGRGSTNAAAVKLQQLHKELAMRLELTQQKLQKLSQPLKEGELEGVNKALTIQMQQQEKAYTSAIKIANRASSAEDAWDEIMARWKQTGAAANVFGNTNEQWNYVVLQLPSLTQARLRAVRAMGLPDNSVAKVLIMGFSVEKTEPRAWKALNVGFFRTRVLATPHPETLQRAAEALRKDRAFSGTPQDYYHLSDTTMHTADWAQAYPNMEKAYNQGLFKNWFGGSKAGKYMLTTLDELIAHGFEHLARCRLQMEEVLGQVIAAMGKDGEGLVLESRFMVSYHRQGEALPPWVDSAGKSRRLTFTMALSYQHLKAAEGGALRLRSLNKNTSKVFEIAAGGGHWAIFYTQEFKQDVTQVRLPCGRWAVTICAEKPQPQKAQKPQTQSLSDKSSRFATAMISNSQSQAKEDQVSDNFTDMTQLCDVCQFPAADGITLDCKPMHRICRECLFKELREETLPTCPACVEDEEGDRVAVFQAWDFLSSESIEELGCVCPNGTSLECKVDPGAKCVIGGQVKGANLNGKLAECIWWSAVHTCWEVRVFATGQIVDISQNSLHIQDACAAGGGLLNCPCWPGGRGVLPVSLGCRCCVKQGIQDCTAVNGVPTGWPYFHGMESFPFDWNLTSLDGILFFLRHDFAGFFHYNTKTVVKAVNREDVRFDNYSSSVQSFLHHSPNTDRGKLSKRIDRFRLLCQHAREARGARPLVFIRYLHESSEFARIPELYSLLCLWAGAHTRLCIVAPHQIDDEEKRRLYRHPDLPRVLIYLCSFIDVMEWSPFVEVCRHAVYDQAGLLQCKTIDMSELPLREFRDPYTTMSSLCKEGDWLTPLKPGQDHSFFPDCRPLQEAWQGREENRRLFNAVSRGDLKQVRDCLPKTAKAVLYTDQIVNKYADPNTWDDQGLRPLHIVGGLEKKNIPTATVVRITASLLLARGDPRCRNRQRITARQYAQRNGASAPVLELLIAAAVEHDFSKDPSALYSALEFVGEPGRSRLARTFAIGGVRPVGEAEHRWRHPAPESEAFIAEIEEILAHLERQPEDKRKKEMKRLLLEWHPDKNADRYDLATTIFQYLQANKDRVVKR